MGRLRLFFFQIPNEVLDIGCMPNKPGRHLRGKSNISLTNALYLCFLTMTKAQGIGIGSSCAWVGSRVQWYADSPKSSGPLLHCNYGATTVKHRGHHECVAKVYPSSSCIRARSIRTTTLLQAAVEGKEAAVILIPSCLAWDEDDWVLSFWVNTKAAYEGCCL